MGEVSEDLLECLDCVLCLKLLYEPVTLNCGHTFCKSCVAQALTFKPQCPMCRNSCWLTASDLTVNVLVNNLIHKLLPASLLESRVKELREEVVEYRIPLFFLDTLLLPDQILHLLVFEPRYKIMLQRLTNGGGSKYFGIQLDQNSRTGVLVEAIKVLEIGLRGFTSSIPIEVKAMFRYEVTSAITDEPGTYGLHYTTVKRFDDDPVPTEDLQLVELQYRRSRELVNGYLSLLTAIHRNRIENNYGKAPPEGSSNVIVNFSFYLCAVLELPQSLRLELWSMRSTSQRYSALLERLEAPPTVGDTAQVTEQQAARIFRRDAMFNNTKLSGTRFFLALLVVTFFILYFNNGFQHHFY